MKTIDEILRQIEENKNAYEAVPTGFQSLDSALDGGFFRKELVTIGAFTGTGKSYLAGQLFLTAARKGYKSAYFSLEISNEMVVSRLIGSLANLKPTRVRMGLLNSFEHEEKVKSATTLSTIGELMAFYDDLYELEKIISEIKAYGCEYVVIDFVQNVIAKGSDEYSRLSHIALELQKTAKECNCVIVILSQVSNSAAREGLDGKILEYKGSGNIATVTDLGFVLERMKSPDGTEEDSGVVLKLKKNRRGSSWISCELNFRQPGGLLYEA